MDAPVDVQIVGVPVACAEGVRDTWREVADWAANQLYARYGSAVRIVYYDLFDPECPPLPSNGQLPLILVGGKVLSSGGKISIPAIRRHLEGIGVTSNGQRN